MSEHFPAYLITKTDQGQRCDRRQLSTADLMDGDVTVAVEYSALNYKDALAMTGAGPVVRHFPLIPGIDFAGSVVASTHAGFAVGDRVLLNGYGVGELHHGGYAGLARVSGDWLLPLPARLSTRQTMAIGTAGYTAMLCLLALERHGLTPEAGEVLVTGATGGVGSIAVALLGGLGYRVIAVTGRPEQRDYLIGLGAADIIERAEFAGKPRALGRERWAAAIDVAGGNTLANVLSQVRRSGAVAACGLVESMALPTSVAPFILRGVTLYGIDSVMAPMAMRTSAWQRLASDLDPALLESISHEIDFDELPAAAQSMLAGRIRGRTLVRIPGQESSARR